VKPAPAAPVAAARATPARGTAANGNREFLALPSSSYIVELAHGASKSELETLRTSLHPARGELYELHLQRDGNDWWLLVWGAFDSVDAARAARSELAADASINAGWPRPVAALQNEARRSGE
jgi:septal ring-binding cell division protein DamX